MDLYKSRLCCEGFVTVLTYEEEKRVGLFDHVNLQWNCLATGNVVQ
jgi:hypothetical protein